MRHIWIKAWIVLAGLFMFNASAAFAQSGGWQCATFARAFSGIQLSGNAGTWWDKAEGIYERSAAPAVGAVMVMKASGVHGMRIGHVATVSRVIGAREVLLTHANWKGDGQVERDVRAVDVSPNNDWSQVRVWHAPSHAMGLTAYPTYGFILNQPIGAATKVAAKTDRATSAAL